MIVGTEWLIEVFECDAERLRDEDLLRRIFALIISELNLKVIGEINWHKFGGAGGVTGLAMLTESHLAGHTYPEYRAATFNLYCCKTRPEWNWEANLRKLLGAKKVKVTKIERGEFESEVRSPKFKIQSSKTPTVNRKSKIENRKSKSAGGES